MRLAIAVLATISFSLLCSIALAQNQSAATGTHPVPQLTCGVHWGEARIASVDGCIRAVMRNTINARKAQPGDRVQMSVQDGPAKSRNGVEIPQGATLVGRVVDAAAWSKRSPESRLGIVVERAEWNGKSVPLKAFIVGQLSFIQEPSRHRSMGPTAILTGKPNGPAINFGGTLADEFDRSRAQTRDYDYYPMLMPFIPNDTNLQPAAQPGSAPVLISHKRNVVLDETQVLILRDEYVAP